MFNRCGFYWVSVCFVGALALLVPAGMARAQFDDGQWFTAPTGVFAVAPNLVDYWSLDAGCSPGYILNGRGDGGDLNSLQNPMPPSTGTRLVRDLNPGSGSSIIGSICHSYIDPICHVFLSADDGSGNQEFYRVLDSLYPVMTLKSDINPGSAGSNPTGLTHQLPGVQGRLYFSADNGTNGRELWTSNTATDGTTSEYMVKDINAGPSNSNPEGFGMAVGNGSSPVIFSADDGTNGRELWKSDSTAAGTTMLVDINTTSVGASSNPQSITTVTYEWLTNSKVFFTADDGINGRELWRTDGTVAGTFMLKDIVVGSGSSNPSNLTPATILTYPSPSALFFTVGNDLWWSKGTTGGTDTLKIKSIGAAMTNLTVVYNAILTSYSLYFTVGNVLWKSDGTSGGTVAVKTFTSAPASLTGARGVLYFAADDGTGSGVELWKTDGTTTAMVKDIKPGAASSSPTNMIALGGGVNIRFSADNGTNGRELWKSDGTTAGTVMVKDINPGAAGSDPANMFLTGPGSTDILFFSADDGEHGRELWESDGYAEVGDSHVGVGYKWDLESLIKSKGDVSKIAIAGTDANVIAVGATFDFPIKGPGLDGISIGGHLATHYIELTDGTDRAPLNITPVDCGDGNLLRPRAALTDGNNHNAIAFGMVAVLDQDPCDQDPRGVSYPGAPFAYVPAIYDGHDWIPMDRAHIPAGVTTNPPVAPTLGQAPYSSNYLPGGLPGDLVAATSDPYSQKRYTWIQLEVWTDYIRAYWYSKNTGAIYVASIPRQYKGAFKALYFGSKGGVQSTCAIYFDSLSINGGLFTDSIDMHGACCTAVGCADVIGGSEACAGGTFSAWKVCGEPSTPLCCPIPWADSDRDGDVDMEDFAALQRCLTPSGITTACTCFDKNADGAINVTDVNKFATCAMGANIALTPAQTTACDTLP